VSCTGATITAHVKIFSFLQRGGRSVLRTENAANRISQKNDQSLLLFIIRTKCEQMLFMTLPCLFLITETYFL